MVMASTFGLTPMARGSGCSASPFAASGANWGWVRLRWCLWPRPAPQPWKTASSPVPTATRCKPRRAAQAVLTFEEAARKVHALHRPTWLNAKHAAPFITTLETYAFPKLGQLKVQDVSTADVLAVLTPIWTDKAETARRVRQRIGAVRKWAIAQGWRQDNPAENMGRALPKASRAQTHRRALPYAEVAGCLAAVAASGAGASTKLAPEFLVLTAARSGEVREARWDEIDTIAKVWEVPAELMKMKRPHRVPLSPRALAILEAAKALDEVPGWFSPARIRAVRCRI